MAINNYQHWETPDMISLWYLLNKQICQILHNMPEEMYLRSCMTEEMHTLEWLATDYVKHLQHHLHAVLKLEPVAYP